jgi:hypothetical protein
MTKCDGVTLGLIVFALAGASGCGSDAPHARLDNGDGVDAATDADVSPEGGMFRTDADAALLPAGPGTGCEDAKKDRGNAGCDFYAVEIPLPETTSPLCFAVFVVNPQPLATKLQLARNGTTFPLYQVARLARGSGWDLQYAPYVEAAGIPPGEIAILFLSGHGCPRGAQPAYSDGVGVGQHIADNAPEVGSGIGDAFHLTSDRPVIAYSVLPYGGAMSYVTSATLLLPVEAWGTHHVAATPSVVVRRDRSLALAVASQDDTEVSFRPTADIVGGDGVSTIASGATGKIRLHAGQFVQLAGAVPGAPATELFGPGLSGTFLTSDKPIGVWSGTPCFFLPKESQACDGALQEVPRLDALGREYAAVRYRNRLPEESAVPWQLVGVADDTTLSYVPDAPTGAPLTLAAGQVAEFDAAEPFTVRSQDAEHPFYLAGYMTGCQYVDPGGERGCPGDPEFVNVTPLDQFKTSYTFLTDPTYPNTNLVVVRKKNSDGAFSDVKLGCAAEPLSSWTPVGDLEFSEVDLVSNSFPRIPGCDNGGNSISSTAPFGITVWGWDHATSYAYPAGAGLATVNDATPPDIR